MEMNSIKFYIKRPDKAIKGQKSRKGKRKSFAVYQRSFKNGKRTGDKVISDPALTSINKSYNDKTLGYIDAEKAVKAFVISLEKRYGIHQKLVFNNDNLKVLKDFWQKEYSTRDLVDENTAYCDFRRAVEAVGQKSLRSSRQDTLEKEIKSKYRGEKQRRIAARLNQILKFLGRGFAIRKDRPEKRVVKHLTHEEFNQVVMHIEDPSLVTLSKVCFFSGMRVGEAFGIESIGISKNFVRVHQQEDKHGILRETKNRKERLSYVFDDGIAALKKWVQERDGFSLSRTNLNKKFRSACEKAFPDNSEKHCKFHDLRHSYAIRLLSKGVSLSLISQSLGNSIGVCEKYYTGHILTQESINYIKDQIKKVSSPDV